MKCFASFCLFYDVKLHKITPGRDRETMCNWGSNPGSCVCARYKIQVFELSSCFHNPKSFPSTPKMYFLSAERKNNGLSAYSCLGNQEFYQEILKGLCGVRDETQVSNMQCCLNPVSFL